MHPEPEHEVDDSHLFKSCLDRPYVQKEIRWARKYKKKFIVVFEKESHRPGFFDYGQAHDKYDGTEWQFVLGIDAIAYQREQYLEEGMMKNILAKACGEQVEPAHSPINEPGHWQFFLSHHQALGGDQMKTLSLLFERAGKSVWYDNGKLDKSESAMEEGVKHCHYFVLLLTAQKSDFAQGAPVQSAQSATAAAPIGQDCSGNPERVYMHVVFSPPPQLIGAHEGNRALRDAIHQVQEQLRGKEEKVLENGRFPVCLTTSSSACEVEEHLRDGRVHCLVWCGRGHGWEARAETELLPSLLGIATIVAALPAAARPQVAVVCLCFGAERAARMLLENGVQNVIWITVDTLSKRCDDVLCDVVGPAVTFLHSGRPAEDVTKFVCSELSKLQGDCASTCGCISNGGAVAWAPVDRDERDWLRVSAPAVSPGINLDPEEDALQLLACDLGCLTELRSWLTVAPHRVHIVSTKGGLGARQSAGDRCRSIALEVCRQVLAGPTRQSVRRVTSDSELSAANLDALDRKSSMLLWLDLHEPTTVEDVTAMQRCLAPNNKGNACKGNLHVILTCGSEIERDKSRWQAVSNLSALLQCEELEIGDETGVCGVVAGELHDEIKIFAIETQGSETQPRCLLDMLPPAQLVAILSHQLNAQVAALYRTDEDNGILVRLCVTDVGFLHTLRDRLLTGDFGRDLSAALEEVLSVSSDEADAEPEPELEVTRKGCVHISVDTTHFAECYEMNILRLNNLTVHQRCKLGQCLEDAASIHIRAPAGAGKTFLALHFMQRLVENGSEARILFCAKNLPLAVFVTKWLAERTKGTSNKKRVLSCVHLLFDSFEDGPRAVSLIDGAITLSLVSAEEQCAAYDLVVIDEAHHIWRDTQLRASVEEHLRSAKRTMFLSDISQSLYGGCDFPAGLKQVDLTEVVRNSKRIVAASLKFQLSEGQEKNLSRCAHDSEGPPLKSFLFDIDYQHERYQAYATKTVRAVRDVTDTFDGLNLHDRLAIIVPDADFAEQLRPELSRELEAEFADTRRFKLVTAAEASAVCSFGRGARKVSALDHGSELVVFDEMEQLDGLERLICICVGLDAAADLEQTGTLVVRSMLYRAMTRAHMLVLVVNEFIAGGWFEYLTTVKLKDDQKFDAEQVRREAQSADAKVAEAQRQRREHEAQADAALTSVTDLSAKARQFMRWHMVDQLQRQAKLEAALGSAQAAWAEKERLSALEEQQRAQTVDALAARGDLDAAERSFLHKRIMAALQRGIDMSTALSDADNQWFEHKQLQRIPELVATVASQVGVDAKMCVNIEEIARARQSNLIRFTASTDVESACSQALEDWRKLGHTLTMLTDEQGVLLRDTDRSSVQAQMVTAWLRGDSMRAAATSCLNSWSLRCAMGLLARQTGSRQLSSSVKRSLQSVVRDLVQSMAPERAVSEAIGGWERVQAVILSEARTRHLSQLGIDAVIMAWGQLGSVERRGTHAAALAQFVSQALDAWQAQQRLELEHSKIEQTVWETRGNETPKPTTFAHVPMAQRKYDFFINHCQTSGQDQCKTLSLLLKEKGATVCYDTQAQDLTATGMEEVRHPCV
eukprot:COSAG01_NODE_2693_length_7243_cov_4.778695_1_plen_1576_part_00